jgi:thioredoxin reductase
MFLHKFRHIETDQRFGSIEQVVCDCLDKYFAGEYDVAVVGAGHAGCEAALAAPMTITS